MLANVYSHLCETEYFFLCILNVSVVLAVVQGGDPWVALS